MESGIYFIISGILFVFIMELQEPIFYVTMLVTIEKKVGNRWIKKKQQKAWNMRKIYSIFKISGYWMMIS